MFFLGSTEATLSAIRKRMADDFPKTQVVGTYSPPFKSTYTKPDVDAMISAVNGARPDVLWVGLTAPKQEKWIFDHCDRLEVRFAAGIGAVFDFYGGNSKRPHAILQRLGLEWLGRFSAEPKRLWRRLFVSSPRFVLDLLVGKLDRRSR